MRVRRVVMYCLCAAAFSAAAGLLNTSFSFARESVLRAADNRTAVRTGAQLERSRKWLDAIEHYEQALKDWPEDKELQYGLRRSKIHFGLERRYADASFDAQLLRLPEPEALSRFDEILREVQTKYVEPLSTTSFVAHGTESLYLALANDKFVKRHLSGADADAVARLRQILRDQYWNKPVADGAAARRTILEVCGLARSTVGLPGTPVIMEYVFGGCNALDDYSNYLTPDKLEDLYGNIEGEFVGLGIEMKAETGSGMHLVNVLPQSPAEEGGLRRGDYIVAIDGADCRNMSTDEAARLLRGTQGSAVRITYERGASAQRREGVFFRREVHIKSIPVARIVDREHGIGYIQMTGFQSSTARELDEALSQLRAQGMRSLIWDVRGNPGGLLPAAVEVLDRFIEDGMLVSTRGRSSDQNFQYRAHRSGTWKVPLVLLVDGDSASASEIVAGAIRDHRRGVIVGRQTFGKWSVQSIVQMRGSAGLRLTTAKFYSPKGVTLGKIGVKPDRVVELAESRETYYRGPEDIHPDRDPDLREGIDVLRDQFAQR